MFGRAAFNRECVDVTNRTSGAFGPPRRTDGLEAHLEDAVRQLADRLKVIVGDDIGRRWCRTA
jgi:hypothetical protein